MFGPTASEIHNGAMNLLRHRELQQKESDTMKVTIRTEWPDVVKRCLYDMHLLSAHVQVEGSLVTLERETDDAYREIAAWLASALACGLIMRGEIER